MADAPVVARLRLGPLLEVAVDQHAVPVAKNLKVSLRVVGGGVVDRVALDPLALDRRCR
jgi:hypothetical protein